MRTWNKKFWFCLTGTVFLAAGVIFLPRYLSRALDMSRLNKVELAEREAFSFLEQSSNSVPESARALQYLNSSEDNLMLISSYDETAKINMELLESVFDQAMAAADSLMLPWIGAPGYDFAKHTSTEIEPYEYWVDTVRFARHYSLTYDSDSDGNIKEMMNFWYLRFSDGKTYDYYFLVNAATYQIYYARIYNQWTNYVVRFSEQMEEVKAIEENNYLSIEEKGLAAQKTYTSIYDSPWAGDYTWEDYYWGYVETFAFGSMNYYGAKDYRYVSAINLNNKLGLATLSFDDATVYIEEIILPESTFPYRGIGIGFQNLGASIQEVLQ